jgi:hypothetical protein
MCESRPFELGKTFFGYYLRGQQHGNTRETENKASTCNYLDIHELRGANIAQSSVIAEMQMGILLIWISNEQTHPKKMCWLFLGYSSKLTLKK